jgi:hypothetical protein
VKLPEAPRKLPGIAVKKDAEYCGARLPEDSIVRSQDGGLLNAVVSIEGIDRGKSFDRSSPVRLEHRGCLFQPRVLALIAGQKLDMINGDAITHTTHAYRNGEITIFNVSLPVQNQRIRREFPTPGLMLLRCDAGHAWQKAWLHVFAHPYFAVTSADGSFVLDGVPPGSWTVKAWHEEAGTQVLHVDVPAGGVAEISFDRLAR